jgi:hypothetical protein
MKKTIETNRVIALFLYTPTCLSQGCPLSNSFVICLKGLVRIFFHYVLFGEGSLWRVVEVWPLPDKS